MIKQASRLLQKVAFTPHETGPRKAMLKARQSRKRACGRRGSPAAQTHSKPCRDSCGQEIQMLIDAILPAPDNQDYSK